MMMTHEELRREILQAFRVPGMDSNVHGVAGDGDIQPAGSIGLTDVFLQMHDNLVEAQDKIAAYIGEKIKEGF